MNFSPGIVFALLTTLSWSIGIFPFTQAARRLGSHSLNHFRLLLATIFLTVASLVIDHTAFVQLFSKEYLQAWLWLGFSGVIGLTIGDYFAFRMYAILGTRIGSVLGTLAPAAALLLGSLLLDEHISWIGITGIAITIFGVINISLGKSERELIPDHGHGNISAGIIAGILGALCQGAGLVLAKKGFLAEQQFQHTVNPVHATFIRLSIATASIFILTFITRSFTKVIRPLKENKDHGIRYAVLGTMFGPFIGVSLSLYTVKFIDVSVAQTFFSLVPVFALVFSFVFFREKISLKSLAGVMIAITGVIILIWRNEIMVTLFK
ncbi:MAG: DMT family transporter [Bacteroidetes bacterium]|nr:DMT family transporter [Bacteroidota bacterium]